MGQTNKTNGDNSMALYFKRPLPHPLVDPHGKGMTPNHREEAAVVAFDAGDPRGRPAILEFDAQFRANGFMRLADANEILTNSHAPIWDRILFRKLDAAIKRGDEEIRALALRQIGWYCYLLDLVRVPRGPLAGRRVTTGGRYRPGGWDSVRDCNQQQINGEKVLEPRLIRNGSVYQDTFPTLVVRDLLKAGELHDIPRAEPPMPCSWVVTRCEDGHVTTAGWLEAGDPLTVGVRYSTGGVTTERVEIGREIGGATIKAAA